MPRVASNPRSFSGPTSSKQKQSPLKIPLNDDRQEKAIRFQSRQALHDTQLTQLKTAASPARRLNNYERAANSSPQTPQNQKGKGEVPGEGGLLSLVSGTSTTPMKRVPILANFEEWMKMATDNKINATNSWNFALIDYFHDMSLLKEGDGVNFQKASCTLDGCVKIYTSRVDSVASETGKLLSGLADSGNKKSGLGEDENADDKENTDDDEGSSKKSKKQKQRSSDTTLAPNFAALQLKKFELEFSVDPLFKKASADFDEGGAKGLLLNQLTTDCQGRIVFDSSDDSVEDPALQLLDADGKGRQLSSEEEEKETPVSETSKRQVMDIDSLRSRFFPNLAILEEQHICPSLRNFELGRPDGISDISCFKDLQNSNESGEHDCDDQVLSDMSISPFIQSTDAVENGNDTAYDHDAQMEADFGEGGEAWARSAQLGFQTVMDGEMPRDDVHSNNEDDLRDSDRFLTNTSAYGISLKQGQQNVDHEGILSYFDNTFKRNWAGPEHWKIRKVKDSSRLNQIAPGRRKEKERYEIDFAADLTPPTSDTVYTLASSLSAISLPRTHYRRRTRNLLPDDKHFSSSRLLHLNLKPKARIGSRKSTLHGARVSEEVAADEMDEQFWARHEDANQQGKSDDAPRGDYNANFFEDEGLAFHGGLPDEDEDFADARETFSPRPDGYKSLDMQSTPEIPGTAGATASGAFGSQLVTQSSRLRPEYLQYARVAKKVDVRRLKEEMWKRMDIEQVLLPSQTPEVNESLSKIEDVSKPLAFTSVMKNLQDVYPRQAMADISTSYCFICLLHLANEKGLTLQNDSGLEELSIRKDFTAQIEEVAA